MSQNNQKTGYMRIVLIQAVIATVLGHMLLLFLFSYKAHKTPAGGYRKPGIKLYNINSNSPELRQKITGWLNTHEPSLIARADHIHANSGRVKPETRMNPVAIYHAPDQAAFPPRRIDVPDKLSEKTELSNINFVNQPPATGGKVSIPVFKYPEVTRNGKLIKIDFPPEITSLANAVNAAPTTMEIDMTEPGRFNIARSSGSDKLDLMTIRYLLDRTVYGKGNSKEIVRIIWHGGTGGKK